MLTWIEATINGSGTEDFGRYVTMGLRLDPENPDMLERNEKWIHKNFCQKKLLLKSLAFRFVISVTENRLL